MIVHGEEPFIECSSKGDKRFSAFFARIKGRGGRSIEEIYQAAKVFNDDGFIRTGLTWRAAKGRTPVNAKEVRELYSKLWDEYIEENPNLIDALCEAQGVSDIFGQQGHACQATELWRIRNYHYPRWFCKRAHGVYHSFSVVGAGLYKQSCEKCGVSWNY